jgi:hypothetical protein
MAQHPGKPDQHGVAHVMTQAVVHGLEEIKVDEHQRAGRVLPVQPGSLAQHLVHEGAAIEQACQRIGAGLFGHVLLDCFVVEDHAHDAGRRTGNQRILPVPGACIGVAPDHQARIGAEARPASDRQDQAAVQVGGIAGLVRVLLQQPGGSMDSGRRAWAAFVQDGQRSSVRLGRDHRGALRPQCVDDRPQRGVHHLLRHGFLADARQDVVQNFAATQPTGDVAGLGVAVGNVDADAACADAFCSSVPAVASARDVRYRRG